MTLGLPSILSPAWNEPALIAGLLVWLAIWAIIRLRRIR